MKHKYKMNPQPRLPILSLFRGEEESYTNKPGWYYQSPESTGHDGMVLTFNRVHLFGGNEPPNIGEAFKSGIVKEIWAVPEKDGVYWEVEVATPPVSWK